MANPRKSFCFPLWLFFRHVLHYGVNRHVLHYGVGITVPLPLWQGKARQRPSKANKAVFKPVVKRYIFLVVVTLLEI